MGEASSGARENAVERAVRELRGWIRRGELAPGEHIRQAAIADHLGISRVPVREALKVLSTEGIIVYQPNHGYYVAKMDPDEIRQLYTMRRLLETELLRSIQWPDEEFLDELTELNRRMEKSGRAGDTHASIRDNRDFHFRILELSPLKLILREVERLWSISDSYRAVYHYSQGTDDVIYRQHDEMIEALLGRDVDSCIYWLNRHRSQAEEYVSRILSARTLSSVSAGVSGDRTAGPGAASDEA